MSKAKRGPTPRAVWQPLRRSQNIPLTDHKREALIRECLARGVSAAEAEAYVERYNQEALAGEVWVNDLVHVGVERRDDGTVAQLAIRRRDRAALRDWRVFQQVKNELAGYECEACELFPADSRLVDTANHYWLWVLRPGERFPFGFSFREVGDAGPLPGGRFPAGARQRALNGVGSSVEPHGGES